MSIFEIDQDLRDIVSEIEDNGGEITPELEEQLAISQKDFSEKVKSYCNVVKNIESDLDAIDKEVTRLQTLKKSKQKTIERIEKVIKWAVETYGEVNKSGNRYFDYGTGKVSLRRTQKVELSEEIIDSVVKQTFNYFDGLRFNKQLCCYKEIDIDTLVSTINDNLNINITKEDLSAVNADLSIKIPIDKLINIYGYELMQDVFDLNPKFSYKANVDKKELKAKLEEENNITIGTIVDNTTVTIK